MKYGMFWCLVALLFVVACGEAEQDAASVRSHLAGRIALSSEVDSTDTFAGFEVLVAHTGGAEVDTLGYAVTDSTGAFALDVVAPERGIYPLLISRGGGTLKQGELVVAEGDSATLTATLPMGNRLLRIISPENAAWLAFRNTRAQYNNALVRILQTGGYDEAQIRNSVQQSATILWAMRETFPGSIAGELASAEAVAMIGGWNDSLAVAWAQQIGPSEAGYADAARVARQAEGRRQGPEAARDLVRSFLAGTDKADVRAPLQQELVLAFMDLDQPDSALAVAQALQDDYPGTPWADWAERAVYELENLLPGMDAPVFAARTATGGRVALDSLAGRYVVLEYYAPRNSIFQRELDLRNSLVRAAPPQSLELISISVEPDTLLNEAFLDGRDLPGIHVFAQNGVEGDLARRYNVNVLPTRYLIDPDGKIVGKYVGNAMPALYQDVLALLADAAEAAPGG